VIGDYVSTAEHPTTHDPSDRRGKFARADHGTHRPDGPDQPPEH
jgi:hypothetical protein